MILIKQLSESHRINKHSLGTKQHNNAPNK